MDKLDKEAILNFLASVEMPKDIKQHIEYMRKQGEKGRRHSYAKGIASGAKWGWDCCIGALEYALNSVEERMPEVPKGKKVGTTHLLFSKRHSLGKKRVCCCVRMVYNWLMNLNRDKKINRIF